MQFPLPGSPKSKQNLGTDGPNSLFNFNKPEREFDFHLLWHLVSDTKLPLQLFSTPAQQLNDTFQVSAGLGLPLQTNLTCPSLLDTALSISSHSIPGSVRAGWGFEQPDLVEGVSVYSRRLERDDLLTQTTLEFSAPSLLFHNTATE